MEKMKEVENMMNEKEREVLRRLEKECAAMKNEVKTHLSKKTWFALRGGMVIAAWECFKAFGEDMSEEFVEEFKQILKENNLQFTDGELVNA